MASVFKEDFTFKSLDNIPDPVGLTSDRPSATVRNELKMSPSDLLEDKESLSRIKEYMATRHGLGVADDLSDADIVDKFINHMRNYQGGNSITTLGETAWLAKADEETRAIAGQAYGTFDKLGNLFGDQNTLSEKVDGVFDYAKSAILDPTNLIAFGSGRLAAGLTGKLAGRWAKRKAIEAVTKLGPNATQAAKAKTYNDFIEKAVRGARIKEGSAARTKKELLAATGTDAALSLGIDIAYQNGMIMSMQQEDWSEFQSGLAALGGLVGGGVSALSVGVRKTSKPDGKIAQAPDKTLAIKLASQQKQARKNAGKNLQKILEDSIKGFTTLKQKSAKYKVQKQELIEEGFTDTEALDEVLFWKYFFLGNDEAGIKGLAQSMLDSGVQFDRRFEGDNITNYAADVITENLSGADLDKFIATMEKGLTGAKTKASLPNFKKGLNALQKSRGVLSNEEKLEFFSRRMASNISNSAKYLSIMRQFADKVAKKQKNVSAEELIENLQEPISKDILTQINEKIGYAQNVIIRAIVTNPGTTALNLTGWSAYSTAQSVADTIKAALYSGTALSKMALGMQSDKKGLYLSRVVQLNVNKIRNMLDPETTMEAFMSYMKARPEAQKELMRYLSGGVDNATFKKQFGFDPEDSMLGRGTENFVNFMQTMYAVKGQDVYTKSVEFFYNIEKQLLQKYGKTYHEFVNETPDLTSFINTRDYVKLEAKAVDDTLRSVFSKKFGSQTYDFGKDPLGSFAKGVEDFRKVPVLGLAMPFGQFFNNTLAFMADFTPLGTGREIYKYFTNERLQKALKIENAKRAARGEPEVQVDIKEQLRRESDIPDAMAKAAIGMTAVRYFAQEEMKNIDEGLGWSEKRDPDTGMVRDLRYDYPYSLFKMAGRMFAHKARGEEIPRDLIQVASETFGFRQFTRQLGEYEFGIGQMVQGLASGELSLTTEAVGKIVGNVTSQAISGVTRPIDPINQVVGLAQGEDFKAIDRKQGLKVLNNSLRYVDNIYASLGGVLAPEKFKGTTGDKARSQIAKVVGFREVPKHSYTQRMFNVIGKPEWRTNVFSRVPEADNRINELLFTYLENNASAVFNSKQFKNGSMRLKMKLVNRALATSKEQVKTRLQNSPLIQDRKMQLAYQITKGKSRTDVARYLKNFAGVDDIMDLNLSQLRMLNELIKDDDATARYALKKYN